MASNAIDKTTLVRGLGLIAAISIILGNVIGTGVFLKARVMTCNVGSPFWVIAAWSAAGILSLAGALTYAELSAMKPEAGGEYVFLRDAYGRVWSFLYGWMQIFIAKTGSQAAVAVAFAVFLNDFLGGKLKQTLLTTNILGFQYELTSLQIIAVMMIVIITTINCASVSVGGQLATYFTVIKIALILLVGIGAFLLADGSFAHFGMSSAGGICESVPDSVKYGAAGYSFAAGFGAAMLGALWGYDGWSNLTLIAGEVKNPQRNIPLALIGGTILVIILYVFVNAAYFYVLDPTQIASVSKDSSVAREVAIRFMGAGAIVLMTAGLMASSLGDAAYFDFDRRARTVCDGAGRLDVQIARQTFERDARSGRRVNRAGNLGLPACSVRFVRHADRLRYFRFVDFLRLRHGFDFRLSPQISRRAAPLQSVRLSGRAVFVSARRGASFIQHDADRFLSGA